MLIITDNKKMDVFGSESFQIRINVNTIMYIFARLRMYKTTRFPRLNDALIGMNHQRL